MLRGGGVGSGCGCFGGVFIKGVCFLNKNLKAT